MSQQAHSPRAGAIVIPALCGADRAVDQLTVDRKFHVGMLEYCRRTRRPMVAVLPRLTDSERTLSLDLVSVPTRDVPYEVALLADRSTSKANLGVVRSVIDTAAVVYGGCAGRLNIAIEGCAQDAGVPFVAIAECSLRTEVDIMRATTASALSRVFHTAELRALHRKKLRVVRRAAALHANGYPVFNELQRFNDRTLLFLDSRMFAADIVTEESLEARTADLRSHRRPLRLLFSGRYHPIKGVREAVQVGIALHRRGLDFEMSFFGAGSDLHAMQAEVQAAQAQDRIHIRGPIPFRPDLIEATKSSDLFISCNLQGDPSCTYLEVLGCGVPIVGFANEMWSPLSDRSKAGLAVTLGDVGLMASTVQRLDRDREYLSNLSSNARRFAASHTMESTWDARMSQVNAIADASPAPRQADE